MASPSPLFSNERFMKKLFELTARQCSAARIAQQFDGSFGRKIADSTITSVWGRYGGKDAFVATMRARKNSGHQFAEPPPAAAPTLMTEDEMHKLAKLLRRLPWKNALAELRPDGPKIGETQARGFLTKYCNGLTAFFEKYGRN